MFYTAQSGFDRDEALRKMPTLLFIKVALSLSGTNRNLKELVDLFPADRNWYDAADFRGHLERTLGKTRKEAFDVFKSVANDPITREIIHVHPAVLLGNNHHQMMWNEEKNKEFLRSLFPAVSA